MQRSTDHRVVAARSGAMALAVGAVLLTASTAAAGGGDTQRVRLLDDCEPTTFNAAVGPGTCVGDGDTTFADFMDQLHENGFVANESADHWKNNPDEFHIDEGDRLRVVNLGGEAHTFTKVPRFGAGCIPEVNHALGLGDAAPVVDCADPGVFPGGLIAAGRATTVKGLEPGTHLFECLIHPWMQSVVTVRADDDDHSGHGGHD